MKLTAFALLALTTLAVSSCNKEKAAIDARTDANAEIDKANIEASKVSAQAQLDADKQKAEAEAVAAKARVDAQK